ncbi:2'-5' RNA ligase family protein [Aestuariirhabdus haliotis]|uniref:2'-5' RNA ligase family protein n=1 Tax=Aestuariirhabdus haliotis TaxID=2918751 RepID=UPI00222860B6|nr:2'-5' RNA ligase family protein [Aestuariirhabdus haliotis]
MAPRFPQAKWVPKQNYHITLYFLGTVGVEQTPALKERLKVIACPASIPVRADSFLWLPDQRRPGALTLSVYSMGQLEAIAEALGNPSPLRAHITIARRVRRIDHRVLADIEVPPFDFELFSLSLRQSLSTLHGVRYPSVLTRWL